MDQQSERSATIYDVVVAAPHPPGLAVVVRLRSVTQLYPQDILQQALDDKQIKTPGIYLVLINQGTDELPWAQTFRVKEQLLYIAERDV